MQYFAPERLKVNMGNTKAKGNKKAAQTDYKAYDAKKQELTSIPRAIVKINLKSVDRYARQLNASMKRNSRKGAKAKRDSSQGLNE